MRTGPTKKATRELIVSLEKLGKSSKKGFWGEIARRLSAPSRRRVEVNVYELNGLAKRNEGRMLVVPGKVLAKGSADTEINVACLACSEKARKTIEAAKGKVLTLRELSTSKIDKPNMLVIVG